MSPLRMRERFGQPQILAGALLLVFLTQCLWLIVRGTEPLDIDSEQLFRVEEGLRQWRGQGVAGTPAPERLEQSTSPPPEIVQNAGYDPEHSPLWYLIAALGLLRWHGASQMNSLAYWGWLSRLPYIAFGLLLGASLWYVARRLYGNAGGYIALTLYCFSPSILRASTLFSALPEVGAAWATFGAVFTAIAVAHTLYAPREVVLWNWRRILLLGLSLALAIGSQFSFVILLPATLLFMLYVAPTRRVAALVIWAAAVALAFLILWASYGFHMDALFAGLRHAKWFEFLSQSILKPFTYRQLTALLIQSGAAILLLLPVAIVTYVIWPRTRYFGNTAPLLVAIACLIFSLASPHSAGDAFGLAALPFLFVFVAGISADLLETASRPFVTAVVTGVLAANALANLMQLAGVGRG